MKDHDHVDPEDETLDARGRLEEALERLLDKDTLNVLLKEVLAITKQVRSWCPNRKKAVYCEVPDSKAVVSAMSELLTQAKGRPGPEAEHDEQTVVNIYYLTGGDGPQEVSHNGAVIEDPVEAARIIAAAKSA